MQLQNELQHNMSKRGQNKEKLKFQKIDFMFHDTVFEYFG
jgi:hypothetical protein